MSIHRMLSKKTDEIMKTVGIIGGSGFIGSHTTKQFLKEGYNVKVSATDISKPENLVLSGEFLYPMDIGSAAYTEYEMLPRPGTNNSPFVKWAMKHIIGKGLQTGHIHSHHHMGK